MWDDTSHQGVPGSAWTNAGLLAACQRGHHEAVRFLLTEGELSLEQGPGENTSSPLATPLEAASANGHLSTVRVLVEIGGADVDHAPAGRGRPLLRAAEAGHLDVCRYLVSRGCDVNSRANASLGTALFAAAQANQLDVVRYLVLEAGANVELGRGLFRGSSLSPLLGACERQAVDVVQFLVTEGGAEVDRVSYNGQTALYVSCEQGCLGAVEALVELGHADVNRAELLFGMTPLYIACRSAHEDVVRYLLVRGRAKVNLGRTDYRFSPFHIACSFGHLAIAQLLAAAGASINNPTIVGSTPRQLAMQRDHGAIIEWLDVVEHWSRLQVALDSRLPDVILERIAVDSPWDPLEVRPGTPSLRKLASTKQSYTGAAEVDEITLQAYRVLMLPYGRKTARFFNREFKQGIWTVLLCAARHTNIANTAVYPGARQSLPWDMWLHVVSFARRGFFFRFRLQAGASDPQEDTRAELEDEHEVFG